MKLSRRSLVTAVVATGLAGLGAVGGGIVWKKLQTPDTNPTGTIAGIDPRVGVGANPAPTLAPITEAAATPSATEISLTATTTPLPTETPTIIPSPTIAPTAAPPTPPKEALRYNGTLSFEAKAWSDNLPFKELVLNPKYPNAQEALKRLILTIHSWGEAASPKPGQVPDQQQLLKMDPYLLETRMLQENITCKIPGHYSDKWDEDNSPGLVEIDPSQGVNFGYIVNKNMLYQPSEGSFYKGNAYMQRTLQFRYISDIKTHKLTIMAITDPSPLDNPTTIASIKSMGGLYFAYWMFYPIDEIRYLDRLYGTNINSVPNKERSKDVFYVIGLPAPENVPLDGKYIVPGYTLKRDPMTNNKRYSLLIY